MKIVEAGIFKNLIAAKSEINCIQLGISVGSSSWYYNS